MQQFGISSFPYRQCHFDNPPSIDGPRLSLSTTTTTAYYTNPAYATYYMPPPQLRSEHHFMCENMPRRSPEPRSHSRVSMAPSDTDTYHSFTDVEPDLHAPVVRSPSPQRKFLPFSVEDDEPAPSQEMRRKDSGYESLTPRDSNTFKRRSTTPASTSAPRPRTRPSMRRSPRSAPVAYLPKNNVAYHRRSYLAPSSRQSNEQQPGTTFFQFPHFKYSEPPPDETELMDTHTTHQMYPHSTAEDDSSELPSPRSETPAAYAVPPQTTHYWTSDRTRRLEYAAIDAATTGIKGWVMRHVVPDCFVPKNKRRVRFEDDRGSVVRYRLELDADEDAGEKKGHAPAAPLSPMQRLKTKVWWFSSPRD